MCGLIEKLNQEVSALIIVCFIHRSHLSHHLQCFSPLLVHTDAVTHSLSLYLDPSPFPSTPPSLPLSLPLAFHLSLSLAVPDTQVEEQQGVWWWIIT